MSKQFVPNQETYANLSSSLATITAESERAAKAREFFSKVDYLLVLPKGSVTSKTTDTRGVFEFRQKQLDGSWVTCKAKCMEHHVKAWRYAQILDPETGEVTGNTVVSVSIRTYLDAQGNILGVSSKNSRFAKETFLGVEAFRAWGHANTAPAKDKDGNELKNEDGSPVLKRFFNVVVASPVGGSKPEDPFAGMPTE